MDRRDLLKSLMALPGVAAIKVATLQPTDVVVLECDGNISMANAERIKALWAEVVPGQKCVVLGDGIKMKIVRQA